MKMEFDDPMYIVASGKLFTAAGAIDVDVTVFMPGNTIEALCKTKTPTDPATYVLPREQSRLKDDVRKTAAKNEALSNDGCQEAMVADQ